MSQNPTPDQTSSTDSTSDVGLSLIQEPVSAETPTSKEDKKQLKPVSTITSTHKEQQPVSTLTHTPREGRKQLPAIPDQDKQVVMASEIKQRQNAALMKNGSNGHGQFYTEYSLMAEYNLLLKQKCPGCYVVPSALTPLIWHGVLFIRQGLYQEAAFRFILTVPENFPDGDCPSLVFSYPVFHPLVDSSTGELDVKRAFPKWRKNANHIWQVLLYARRVFYKIDTKLPWNKQAATLYETDMDSFKKNVEQTVKTSKEKIHDPVKSDDPHILRFTPLDPSVHEEVRKQMLSLQEKQNECNYHKGMSWMKPASVHIFTREDSASA